MFKSLLALSVLFVFTSESQAWNKPGHMVTGAVAYDSLKAKNPEALARVLALFKEHPHYVSWLPTINLLPAENQDRYLFMKAARWPDDVRDDDQYGGDARAVWHYINFPFVPDGQPDTVKPKDPAATNIFTAFEEQSTLARKKDADDDERAVALCWVFHLVGDVHQPLHTSTLFTTDFPHGDRGGTRFYIREIGHKTTEHLHGYWDALVIKSDAPKAVKKRAELIAIDLPRNALSELEKPSAFKAWADESFILAKKHGYRDGKLQGSRDEDNGTVLPKGYRQEVQPIAVRRAALAGYRLADLLEEWFKE
jgi:S1/P1 Nuclease